MKPGAHIVNAPTLLLLFVVVAAFAAHAHANHSNHTIHLAISCDNTCDVWIAGRQVLSTAQSPAWEVVHQLTVNDLPPGEYVVAVRAVDWHVVAMILATVVVDGRAVGWTGGAGWQFASVTPSDASWMYHVSDGNTTVNEWSSAYTRCWEHPAYPANSLIQRTTINGSTPYYVWSSAGCNYPQVVTLYARFVVRVEGVVGGVATATTTTTAAAAATPTTSIVDSGDGDDNTGAAASPPPSDTTTTTLVLVGGAVVSVLVAISALMAYTRRRHAQRPTPPAHAKAATSEYVLSGDNPLYVDFGGSARWAVRGENPLYVGRG